MTMNSLGEILDSQVTMGNHSVALNRAYYFHIRALRHIVADTRSAIRNDLQRPVMSGIGVQGLATIYSAL